MPDLRKLARANMRAVIGWFGCLDAAAETINSRWDCGTNKSTLSKKLSGQLDFTISDVIALEDAADRYPVTRLLARRLEGQAGDVVDCMFEQSGVIAKETGEAIAAIIAAQKSSSSANNTNALKELHEAVAALLAASNTIEQEEKRITIPPVMGVVS